MKSNKQNDDKVNNIAGYNLLPDTLNSFKHTKNKNIHYYPILHGCMNICNGYTYEVEEKGCGNSGKVLGGNFSLTGEDGAVCIDGEDSFKYLGRILH